MNPHPWRLPPADWWLVAPELLLLGAAAIISFTSSPRLARATALMAVGLAIPLLWSPLAALLEAGAEGPIPFFARRDALLTGWWGAVTVDGLSVTARGGLLVAAWLWLLGDRQLLRPPERSLQIVAVAAVCLVTQASDLVTLWIATELAAIAVRLSAVAARTCGDQRGELFRGAAFGALFLWGISILYGLTGTTAIYGYPDRPDTLAFERRDALSEVLGAAPARPGGLEVTLVGMACAVGGLLLRGGFLAGLREPPPGARPVWTAYLLMAAAWAPAARLLYACFPGDWWEFPVTGLGITGFVATGAMALRPGSTARVCAIAQAGVAWAALAALGPLPTPIPPDPEPLELGLGSGPLCLLLASLVSAAGLGTASTAPIQANALLVRLAVRYLQASAALCPLGAGSLGMALTVAPMFSGSGPWPALGATLAAGGALFVVALLLAARRDARSAAPPVPAGAAAVPSAALLVAMSLAAFPIVQFLSRFR